ncbi:hypothetical protein WG66_001741 [Moniliophthora roreri]|nr:hypothetical protein WG66_001741 [Moniliophthora roreri]
MQAESAKRSLLLVIPCNLPTFYLGSLCRKIIRRAPKMEPQGSVN